MTGASFRARRTTPTQRPLRDPVGEVVTEAEP